MSSVADECQLKVLLLLLRRSCSTLMTSQAASLQHRAGPDGINNAHLSHSSSNLLNMRSSMLTTSYVDHLLQISVKPTMSENRIVTCSRAKHTVSRIIHCIHVEVCKILRAGRLEPRELLEPLTYSLLFLAIKLPTQTVSDSCQAVRAHLQAAGGAGLPGRRSAVSRVSRAVCCCYLLMLLRGVCLPLCQPSNDVRWQYLCQQVIVAAALSLTFDALLHHELWQCNTAAVIRCVTRGGHGQVQNDTVQHICLLFAACLATASSHLSGQQEQGALLCSWPGLKADSSITTCFATPCIQPTWLLILAKSSSCLSGLSMKSFTPLSSAARASDSPLRPVTNTIGSSMGENLARSMRQTCRLESHKITNTCTVIGKVHKSEVSVVWVHLYGG